MRETHDTVIIGGGQAGLVMSHHLRQRGREHIVLERHRIAERWRSERWNSLRFQLPNSWLALPGKPYQGTDADGFSHYTDVVQLLIDFAAAISAPVRTGVDVMRLARDSQSSGYVLDTTSGEIRARHVVIATGPFQRPSLPAFAAGVSSRVYQTDSSRYRSPEDLPTGAVLVVGSGNSGCQIAHELLRSGRRVLLAASRHTSVPRRYRGRDVIWWYDALGRFDVDIETLPGKRYPPTTLMTGMDGGYDISPRLLAGEGAKLVGRIRGASGERLQLGDDLGKILNAADESHAAFIAAADRWAVASEAGAELAPKETFARPGPLLVETCPELDLQEEGVRSIVWANGYGFAFDWVKLPIIGEGGAPVQRRGVTGCEGVYFLGLHWMHSFRSAILTFVERDASYLADHIDGLSGAARG
ncbi:flavin-containing monooxygenase [Aestuariivirga sp.]|uniref:flavin-containing monooxygenase n=1 Tax=Aestuariivirga sp. TaxID=2650926 RepID=UPI00391DB35F